MPPSESVHPAIPRPIELPNVSYGPFRLFEAVPWLMLASAIRFVSYGNGGKVVVGLVFSAFALFLAYLLAARRMIEFADGRTELGKLTFRQQLSMARRILSYGLVLSLIAGLALIPFGAHKLSPHLLMGIDGIAFDQFSKTGMVWSSILAAIMLLLVVKADVRGKFSIRELWDTLQELVARSSCLFPAIVAVAAMQFGLSAIQGVARGWVYVFWQTSEVPQNVKNLVYFAFVFGFATLRLWLTLAILTFALRESYRRGQV
jgi:hypothetical protein